MSDTCVTSRPLKPGRFVAALALVGLLAQPAGAAPQGPSVAALVAACERGLARGNTGVDAAMCEWYAVPCDCKLTAQDWELERWCMPQTESLDHAMVKVLAELRRQPDQTAPAERVVPGILSRLYPCPPPADAVPARR